MMPGSYDQRISESLTECQRLLYELEARRKAGILSAEQQQRLAELTQERKVLEELLSEPIERDSA